MLNRYSVAAALLNSTLLQRGSVIASPRKGSPLSSLVAATYIPSLWSAENLMALTPGSPEEDEIIVDSLVSCNQTPVECGVGERATGLSSTTVHDVIQSGLIAETVDAVRRHMSAARNIVKPRVMELALAVTADIDSVPSSRLMDVEIEMFSVTPIIAMPVFQTLVDRFCPATYVKESFVRFAGILPVISTDELIDIMMSNFDSGTAVGVRAKMKEWLAIKGNNFIEVVWNKYFLEPYLNLKPRDVNLGYRHEELMNAPDDRVDEIAVVFLLAAGLYDSPPKDTNVDLAFFNEKIDIMRMNAAMSLSNKARYDNGIDMSNSLVREFQQNKIVVNNNVFTKWVDEMGGVPDALLGMMLTKDRYFQISDIDNRAAEYVEIWERHARHDAHSYRMKQYDTFQSSLRKHFSIMTESLEPNEQEIMGNRNTALKTADNIISAVIMSDMDNIFNVAKKVVCRGIFAATDAESILDSVSNYMSNGDRNDIAEAEAIATVEYIAKWVSKMMVRARAGSIDDMSNAIAFDNGRIGISHSRSPYR